LLSQKHWNAIAPSEREVTLAAMLAQPSHISHVLDAIESGALPRNALSAAQRTALSKNKDTAIRDRAAKLLGAPADGDRMKAYEAEKVVLGLTPKAAHGREVFKTICSTCHRLDREGHQVGPDLLDIRSQPKESILLHIVVPDYEIAPGYAASNVELKDGRALVGIVISETPESITVRGPLAVEENILRSNISSFTASEHSLMPPGLEAMMSKQDMADLLSFLKGEN
jgi:putative heme-binding domain-containing protein